MKEMIRFLDDIVDEVGGIANFILCIFLAGILTSAFMMFLASAFMLYCKAR